MRTFQLVKQTTRDDVKGSQSSVISIGECTTCHVLMRAEHLHASPINPDAAYCPRCKRELDGIGR